MLAKTSGIDGLAGINLGSVYFVLLVGLIALIAGLIRNKGKFSIVSKPKMADLALFLIILIQGAILLLYFQKFPIFPQSQSEDFGNHVSYVLGLISGSTTSIPQGLLYFGVHYQLASSYLLVGGEPLVSIQRTMALLMIFSPLLFFIVGKKLFSENTVVGLITASVYTLSGTIWYTGPIDAGLYPNFFGILATLFILFVILSLTKNPKSAALWIIFILALVNGYMSHYTFLTIIPAILVLPVVSVLKIVLFRSENKNRKLVVLGNIIPALVMVLPVAIPFLIYPKIGEYALYLATNGGGIIIGPTFLAGALSFFPFAHFLAIEVHDDVALTVLFLLGLYCLYRAITSKNIFVFVPIIWFLALALAAPINGSAWRFSYEATVPLTLAACYSIYQIGASVMGMRSQKTATITLRMKRGASNSKPLRAVAIVVILVGTITVGAIGTQTVAGSLTSTPTVSEPASANDVYQAIYWLKANTPNGSQYLSVSDWRFTYTDLMIGRVTHYEYIYNVTSAMVAAKDSSSNYILVTYLLTANAPNYSGFYPWNTFPSDSNGNLTLIFSNPDVRVFQIPGT